MHNNDHEELQRRDQWEEDDGEVHEPAKTRRAVVSVAFSREDFERVAECARGLGMKTSEFIRETALDHARPSRSYHTEVKVSGSVFTGFPRQTDRGDISLIKIETKEPAYTSTR